MKQRAVEWLVEQICGDHTSEWHKQIEQAKAMEKEQIKEAIRDTEIELRGYYNDGDAEYYYNETFKSE